MTKDDEIMELGTLEEHVESAEAATPATPAEAQVTMKTWLVIAVGRH